LQVVALHNDLFLIEGAIKKQEEDGWSQKFGSGDFVKNESFW
jgi:hypothetical protein